MNPRSTYQEGKKTSKSNLTSSVDRATFQGSSLTASHPKTPNLSAQSEKMSRYISMVLQKVSNEPQRYSGVVPVLKSTNRSLISVISALMRSVDGHFDSSDLEADMIVELFRMIGYTNNISKTIFQPIGAPHTWPSCLQMVEWLAQLSEFHLRLSEVLEERHCQEDMNDRIIDSFVEQDQTIVSNYMKEHMKVLEKELTDIAYVYESKQLAIRNLNNTQRDLQLMEAEEKKEAELYFRTEQETIEIDEQNRRIVQDLAQMDMLLLEEDRIAAINEQVVAHLKYEIGHQEMSVEETELVKLEIRNTKERILECKREHERNIVMLETQCSQCLEHFCQRQSALQGIQNTYATLQPQIVKILPKQADKKWWALANQDRTAIMNYLRNKQEEARQSEIDEILNLRQTERFVEEQQDLLRLLKVELTCVIDQQEEAAARRNKIEAYNLDVTERLRSFKTAEEEIRNSKAKTVSKKQEYSLRLHDLEGQQDAVEHKKIEKTMELDAAKAQLAQNLQNVKELIDVKQAYEQASKAKIAVVKAKLKSCKARLVQALKHQNKELIQIRNSFPALRADGV